MGLGLQLLDTERGLLGPGLELLAPLSHQLLGPQFLLDQVFVRLVPPPDRLHRLGVGLTGLGIRLTGLGVGLTGVGIGLEIPICLDRREFVLETEDLFITGVRCRGRRFRQVPGQPYAGPRRLREQGTAGERRTVLDVLLQQAMAAGADMARCLACGTDLFDPGCPRLSAALSNPCPFVPSVTH